MSDVSVAEEENGTGVAEQRPVYREPVVILWAASVVLAVVLPLVKLSSAFGLPAHPLLLHVPVVLVPVSAVAVVALTVRPAWIERWGVPVGVTTLLAMASTILTAGAGEKLRDERTGGSRFPGGFPGAGRQGGGQGRTAPTAVPTDGAQGSVPTAAPTQMPGNGQGGAFGGNGNFPGNGQFPRGGQGGGFQGGGQDGIAHHAALGHQLQLMVIALGVAFLLFLVVRRLRARGVQIASAPALGWALAAISVVAAVLSFVWVVRTGHAGAELTWSQGS